MRFSQRYWVALGIGMYLTLSAACAMVDPVILQLPKNAQDGVGSVLPYMLLLAGPPVNLVAGAVGIKFYVFETLGLVILIGALALAHRRSIEALAVIGLFVVAYWIACALFSLTLVA